MVVFHIQLPLMTFPFPFSEVLIQLIVRGIEKGSKRSVSLYLTRSYIGYLCKVCLYPVFDQWCRRMNGFAVAS